MSLVKEFNAEILEAEKYKNGAYITMPFDVEKVFGKKRLKVKATFDGVLYRGLVTRMGTPDYILIIRKDIRAQIGKNIGDQIAVRIEEDTEVRTVTVPSDLAEKMKAEPTVLAFFKKLSYTHQKEYVQWIEAAKRTETRERRITKTLELLKAEKKTR